MQEMKQEVEELLGCRISDRQFTRALEYAKRKQEHIFALEHRPVTMEHWYLVKLTEEFVRNLALSDLTIDLCTAFHNMEKEHPFDHEQGAPKAIPIVNAFTP